MIQEKQQETRKINCLLEKNLEQSAKNPNLSQDRQGINWNNIGQLRNVFRAKRLAQYRPFRDNIHKQMPKYPKQAISQRDLYNFHAFYPDLRIKVTHFQLRYCIQALSPHDVLYVTNKGVGLLNTESNMEVNQYLKYDLEPTMINCCDNLLVFAGMAGDVSIMDARNFRHINHFRITENNDITNYVGFLSNSSLGSNNNNQQENFFDENYVMEVRQENEQIQQQQQQDQMELENMLNNNNIEIEQQQQQQSQSQNQDNIECFKQEKLNLKNSVMNDLDVKLLTGCNDRYLKVFDLEKNKEFLSNQFSTPPNTAAYNPHRKLIALQCDQIETEILDSRTLKRTGLLKGHEDFGFSVDWNSDGNEVATGNQDGTVRIFDIRKGECIRILQGEFAHTCCVKYTNNKQLIVGESVDFVHIYDIQRDYVEQKIDFFGDLNGISVIEDNMYFGVNIRDYEGLFQYKYNHPYKQLDIFDQEDLYL